MYAHLMCRVYGNANSWGMGYVFLGRTNLTVILQTCILPVLLWCRVGNTGIKCRFVADDDAPSEDGHSLHQGYIHLQCL